MWFGQPFCNLGLNLEPKLLLHYSLNVYEIGRNVLLLENWNNIKKNVFSPFNLNLRWYLSEILFIKICNWIKQAMITLRGMAE